MMKRQILVFIASPGDLTQERSYFKEAIVQLNAGFADGANVEFVPLGWEDTLATTGRRNQCVINEEIDRCHVFILVMYRRWGQEALDAHPYTSYTEEEFHRALNRFHADSTPEIFVFFKRVDPESEADPGPQLQKVINFRKHLEDSRQVLYHYFDSQESFIKEIDRHLRAYAKGELPQTNKESNSLILPLAILDEIESAKKQLEEKIYEAEESRNKVEELQLELEKMQLEVAENAALFSKQGKIEYAREKFSTLSVSSDNIKILSLSYEFFNRTGDLDAAFKILKKWLVLSGKEQQRSETASAYGNLGILYQTRGDLEQAEEMYRKSLSIEEALGHKEGMANQYGNLGILYQTRGDLEQAEEMYRKSLSIEEALGRKEGMASDYGNLGNLYKTRGDLEQAEEMYEKALQLFKSIKSPKADYLMGLIKNLKPTNSEN